ncbi:hypothetical protein [Micrococcus terreus]|uniref:hypothetical protein n=1 Tax=Micrococcus terreus TaxID=574650 RepID=UPI00254EAA3A|nr:hypothetical protein [Micrococcus terreus]MDK7700601.1 hypothetical protein [Micrococcus terreus]WOO97658.1 hypothetical protein R3I42_00280 [Micrococcus terreus]
MTSPLHALSSALLAATQAPASTPEPAIPEPTLRPGLDQTEVTPGIEGFLFTALMVAMAIIVIRLMIRSVRRVKHRSETAEEMLVERYQSHLPEEIRRNPDSDVPDPQERLRQKYPGYLDQPIQQPQGPDSGRD